MSSFLLWGGGEERGGDKARGRQGEGGLFVIIIILIFIIRFQYAVILSGATEGRAVEPSGANREERDRSAEGGPEGRAWRRAANSLPKAARRVAPEGASNDPVELLVMG